MAGKKRKSLTIAYWTATILFCVLLTLDGIGGVTHAEAGRVVLDHLGYPPYLLTITGVAKLLAVPAILQPFWRAIKEWAFAGFAINCAGAFASRLYVGDGMLDLSMPVIFLAVMFIPYVIWKTIEA